MTVKFSMCIVYDYCLCSATFEAIWMRGFWNQHLYFSYHVSFCPWLCLENTSKHISKKTLYESDTLQWTPLLWYSEEICQFFPEVLNSQRQQGIPGVAPFIEVSMEPFTIATFWKGDDNNPLHKNESGYPRYHHILGRQHPAAENWYLDHKWENRMSTQVIWSARDPVFKKQALH